jgi:hypothetical protein
MPIAIAQTRTDESPIRLAAATSSGDGADLGADSGAVEEKVETAHQRDRGDEGQHLEQADIDVVAERDGRRFHPAAPDFARVGAEAFQQSVLDNDREAERDQDDEQDVFAHDALQEEALQRKAGRKRDRQDDQRCDDRIEAKRFGQDQQHEAEQDDEVAVCDVDETHDAVPRLRGSGA